MTQTQEVIQPNEKSARYQHLVKYQWGPGKSPNPKGRPKGCKQKLGEDFVSALQEDFKKNGMAVIEKVRDTRPADYLKIIASIVPKEFTFREEGSTKQATDDELFEKLNTIRHLLVEGIGRENSQGTEIPRAEEVTDGEPV